MVGQYFNIIVTLQYQYHKYFHISIISHVQCITVHISILQYSALIKFVSTTNTEIQIHTNSEVSYQVLLQFLMAHMFNDVVPCSFRDKP